MFQLLGHIKNYKKEELTTLLSAVKKSYVNNQHEYTIRKSNINKIENEINLRNKITKRKSNKIH